MALLIYIFLELFPAFRCNLFFQKGFPLQSGLKNSRLRYKKTKPITMTGFQYILLLLILKLIVDIVDQPVCHRYFRDKNPVDL